jgi:DNA repair photolyase
LFKPGYKPSLIVVGANTGPYQPVERKLPLTRAVLEVLAEYKVPVGIITKSALVTRDIDILRFMAAHGLVQVSISVTPLDNALALRMAPRASAPASRLQAMKTLAQAGIPVAVFALPMIPAINDVELEKILQASANAGARYARYASYVLLRLPLEVRDLFVQWLQQHYPLRATDVMHRVQATRGGKDYDPDFATRMKGSGICAQLLA